jgi:hypothetical protein
MAEPGALSRRSRRMDSSEVKKTIDFSETLLKDFFDLDAFRDECRLFLSRATLDKRSWLNHFIPRGW